VGMDRAEDTHVIRTPQRPASAPAAAPAA
jgi:hypothetical protein